MMFVFLVTSNKGVLISQFGISVEPKDPRIYEGESINNQPIPFPMDRDGHDFHALFQYMIYTWVQNYTRIESYFNKILNVKHG